MGSAAEGSQENTVNDIRAKRRASGTAAAGPERGKKTMSYLIKDTTREERERIVADAIGNVNGACDGCAAGLADMYQDYIDGKRELKEINMSFRAGYVSGDEEPTKGTCGFQK